MGSGSEPQSDHTGPIQFNGTLCRFEYLENEAGIWVCVNDGQSIGITRATENKGLLDWQPHLSLSPGPSRDRSLGKPLLPWALFFCVWAHLPTCVGSFFSRLESQPLAWGT